MSTHVHCPNCGHEFLADLAPRKSSTLRSLEPVHEPIREGVPICKWCGLIQRLHEGEGNLALARGCTGFEVES